MTSQQLAQYDSAIYRTAINMGVPDLVAKNLVAQARFETGDYSNTVFLQNNNAFGYKRYPGSKWQVGVGNTSSEGDSYAKYSSVENSAGEVVMWLKNHCAPIESMADSATYASRLKANGYYGADESTYAAGLAAKLRNINWSAVSTAATASIGFFTGTGAAILLLAVASYFLLTD